MKITSMEQVKQNVGKRVLFQCKLSSPQVTGKIVYGEVEDCERDVVGFEGVYSVLYDNSVYDNLSNFYKTWYNIEEEDFFQNDIVLFETIED